MTVKLMKPIVHLSLRHLCAFALAFLISGAVSLRASEGFAPPAVIFEEEGRYKKLITTELSALAEKGDPIAQKVLGNRYSYGEQVEKDQAKAVLWWSKSAEQGYLPAINNLGMAYLDGQGVDKDENKAIALLKKASDRGFHLSMRTIAIFYYQKNKFSEAFPLALELAMSNDAYAQYMLVYMYSNGSGVNVDVIEALGWAYIFNSSQSNVAIDSELRENLKKFLARAHCI